MTQVKSGCDHHTGHFNYKKKNRKQKYLNFNPQSPFCK